MWSPVSPLLPLALAEPHSETGMKDLTFKYVEVLKTRRKRDHLHPQVEILMIKQGSGTWIIGDSLGEFREGDLFVMGSGLAHTFFPSPEAKEEIRALVMHFQPAAMVRALTAFPEFRGFESFLAAARHGLRVGGDTRGVVIPLLRRIGEMPPATSRSLGLFISVLAELSAAEDLTAISGPRPFLAPGDGLDEKLDRVSKLIQANLVNPLSQSAVADRIGLSPAAFSRWFKRRMGKTYTDYINEARIELVCHALMESDREVSRIARESGFAGGSHFHRLFKACKGVAPTEYRRLSRAE
jgi:AraC-like DNA-binding protein/mannose-6-phosphate isomerase-like protein (cupin superfamily)